MKVKKALAKRYARKKALRKPKQLEDNCTASKRDCMSASKRSRGIGKALDK